MKAFLKTILAVAVAAAVALPGVAEVNREHRAIWMSPSLSSTWPGRAITASNAAAVRRDLDRRLDRIAGQGINVIYFHTRVNCDALYYSSFEPLSGAVADGGRGGTAAFDPFAYVIESAHARGIEVYAWVNPLRYSSGGHYGAGDLNYENSHPEWLMSSSEQIILNPALPEVRERVAAICAEMAANYDIDGMLFDDYFYHSSIELDADDDLYNAYRTAGGELTHKAWRRENINMVVEACRNAVRNARPYAVFAMGPAGRISPDDIRDYGLEPGPYGDMNYDGLFADPIKWLANGWLDFLSPQVYWHSYFDRLTEWYSVAVPHFGRHLYTSVDCSRLGNNAAEYIRQIEFMRSHLRPNESGVVFFDYGAYSNYYEVYEGKNRRFGEILNMTVFPTRVPVPMRHWEKAYEPVEVANLRREGSRLVWDEPTDAANRRYIVYALPDGTSTADFAYDKAYLKNIVYSGEYDLGNETALTYGVAVYDRYGNEYSAVFEGSALADGAPAANLTPADGAEPPALLEFTWSGTPGAKYVVEVSETADFATVLGRAEAFEPRIAGSDVADMRQGATYFWRVWTLAPSLTGAVANGGSFTVGAFTVTSPAADTEGCSTEPQITWNSAGPGAAYTVAISEKSDMSKVICTLDADGLAATVPAHTLVTGRDYYVTVTATAAGLTVTTPAVHFATVNRTDYGSPVFARPSADGATVYADQGLELEQWEGMVNAYVEISASTTFTPRSIFNATLADFSTATRPLGEIRISGKALVDGNTYYARTRGSYALTTSNGLSYTDYSPVRSFVYSAQLSGVHNIESEAFNAYVDADNVLTLSVAAPVGVYDLSGRCMARYAAAERVDLAALAPGCYIIRIAGPNNLALKWVKR